MTKRFNTRILFSAAVLCVAAAFILGATFAVFSDTETSSGNVLAAGALDLKIDNESYYNGVLNEDTTWDLDDLTDRLFFDFTDVKPDDLGEDTISLHTENDSWVCADFTLTSNLENSCGSVEEEDEPACTQEGPGELGDNIEFVFWADDGDNVLETDEVENIITEGNASEVLDSKIVLADSQTNNLGGADTTPMIGGQTHYIAKAWCFGNLELDPLTPGDENTPANSTGGVTCNGTLLDNSTQTDSLIADIQFSAVQARHNPDFVCEPEEVEISCTENDIQYASGSSDNNQGDRKDGGTILSNRTIPSAMFGLPDTSGAASDVGFPAGSFFALGFTGGNIVLNFASPFYQNSGGPDLQVFEVTGGVYPDEKVKVEVSADGSTWFTATPNPGIRDAGFEMPILSASHVRLTEASDITLFPNDADGYDVDAVKTFCKAQPVQ